jgi:aspartyl-tRNA(Asn)/glutamyl-tRNA(Gln) amidotransferase subunit B
VSPGIAAPFFAKLLLKTLNYSTLRLKDTKLSAEHLTKLLKALERKEVTERAAELLLRDLIVSPKPPDPEELLKLRGMERIFDEAQLQPTIEKVLTANARAVLDFRTGRKESFEFLVGQVMRETKGRADPGVIREMLKKRLER